MSADNLKRQISVSDNNLVIFKGISNFVNDLSNVFEKDHQLSLYKRLLEKTTITHDVAIKRHVDAFKIFCSVNDDAIASSDYKKMTAENITYSERVFIKVKKFCEIADNETRDAIFTHLQYISVTINPHGNMKQTLKEHLQKSESGPKEQEFISSLMEKVEKSIDPNSIDANNPMQAVTTILQSGIINDVVGSIQTGINDGSLDFGKLLGTMQGMVGNMMPPEGSSDQNPMAGLDIGSIMQMAPNILGLMNMMGPASNQNPNNL